MRPRTRASWPGSGAATSAGDATSSVAITPSVEPRRPAWLSGGETWLTRAPREGTEGFPRPAPVLAAERRVPPSRGLETGAAYSEIHDLRDPAAALSRRSGSRRIGGAAQPRRRRKPRALSSPSPDALRTIHTAPRSRWPELLIELTGGNIRNGHFYLRRHLSYFPDDAVGPANSRTGTGDPVTVHFAGRPAPVVTDIAGGNKLMLRCAVRSQRSSSSTLWTLATRLPYNACLNANSRCGLLSLRLLIERLPNSTRRRERAEGSRPSAASREERKGRKRRIVEERLTPLRVRPARFFEHWLFVLRRAAASSSSR